MCYIVINNFNMGATGNKYYVIICMYIFILKSTKMRLQTHYTKKNYCLVICKKKSFGLNLYCNLHLIRAARFEYSPRALYLVAAAPPITVKYCVITRVE